MIAEVATSADVGLLMIFAVMNCALTLFWTHCFIDTAKREILKAIKEKKGL